MSSHLIVFSVFFAHITISSSLDLNFDHISDQLNQWIIDNRLIENIFGPNLHVEVIKQSHYILSCISPKITTEHIDIIWSSAQIKHYERYIFEILSQLVKNFNLKPVLYLYNLLWKIKPNNHSEHTLNLSSQIIKYLWSHRGDVHPDMINSCQYIPNEKALEEAGCFTKGPHSLYSYFRGKADCHTCLRLVDNNVNHLHIYRTNEQNV